MKKKIKNKNKSSEPSLFRQIVAIHYEQAKRRKAIRDLAKLEWSMEFLTEVVRRAAAAYKTDIAISVKSKGGNEIIIKSVNAEHSKYDDSFDIFNHLDDDVAIDRFIREHSKR